MQNCRIRVSYSPPVACIVSVCDNTALVAVIEIPPRGSAAMSSDQPLSVAERIAALQKNAGSNNNSSTTSSSSSLAGGGVQVGGKKKVSALAGDLSSKLNMNALLAGGAPRGGGIGGSNRPSSSVNDVEAVADPSRSAAAAAQTIMTNIAKNDNEITKGGEMPHPPRAMIPPGRRRRRGGR